MTKYDSYKSIFASSLKNIFLSFSASILLVMIISCSNDEATVSELNTNDTYFPPLSNSEWESLNPNELHWEEEKLNDLFSFLETNNTRAFIVLKNGKIVVEKYWGKTILGTSDFTATSQWYWASAGKSLTAALVGIAQQNGLLNINNKTSDYLGEGWTQMPTEQESKITIKHQLSMATGLDYEVEDLNCTEPSCLIFKNEPNQVWFYHNAPYTLLEKVVQNAVGMSYNDYTHQVLKATIGMNGRWLSQGYNNVYWSSARDMARFGLLILNKGNWDGKAILNDLTYYEQMINSSQELNPAYGFLWWLNGKESIIFPSVSNAINIELASNAPKDLITALGKNGQFINVIPSENMVVIRIGEAPEDSLVPILFHNQMWEKFSDLMN